MKRRLTQFVTQLRANGIRISTAEAIDSANAVAAIGIERDEFREALAAALIKDEADRGTFDSIFDDFFLPHPATRRRPKRALGSVVGSGGRGEEGHSEATRPRADRDEPAPETPKKKPNVGKPRPQTRRGGPGEKLREQRELLDRPFRELDADEIEACTILAEHLARRIRAKWRRRAERAKRGRVDVRRMMRRSIPRGGVPLELSFRRPRPGRPNLVALCDLSHSVAAASEFLLALLAPARGAFRRVRLLGFVDTPVGIDVEHGRLTTESPIDLMARSDFGNVLRGLCEREQRHVDRNTILLVLGDARNNRRPARVDLLRELRQRARRVVWLNPEATSRWGSGDSAIDQYAGECDELLAAATPRALARALDHLNK